MRKNIIIVCSIGICASLILWIAFSQKKEVSIEAFLNIINSSTKIELYTKIEDNVQYRKIKDITDIESINLITELFNSYKDNQEYPDIALYYSGILLKFIYEDDIIAEYNGKKIYNKDEYAKIELNKSTILKLCDYAKS